MIPVYILFTIIGLGCIIRGFVIPEFIENLGLDAERESHKDMDAGKIAKIFYWIVRVIWTIMWLVSGLSTLILSWFARKLPLRWIDIHLVGSFNPLIIIGGLITFGALLYILFGTN